MRFAILSDIHGPNENVNTQEFQKIECYNIQYNIEDTIKALREVDNVDKNLSWERMCVEILKTGKDYTKECIDKYNQLRKEKNIEEESLELWKSALASVFYEEYKTNI